MVCSSSATALILSPVRFAAAQGDSDAVVSEAAAPNSWVATTTAGAPAGRFIHTAIWTGSKMIVWGGGAETFDSFADGRIYDPATNKWTVVGSFNAPSAREAALPGPAPDDRGAAYSSKRSLEASKILADRRLRPGDRLTKPRPSFAARRTAPSDRIRNDRLGDRQGCSPEGPTTANTGAIFEPVSNTGGDFEGRGPPRATGIPLCDGLADDHLGRRRWEINDS
jgi:hypothetical protein